MIEHVANLLQITYSSTFQLERKCAEDSLISLSSDYSKYFQVLLCIISSSMSDKVKNAAGLHLKRLVKGCSDNGSLQSEEIEAWGEVIFTNLTQPGLDACLRANLGYALIPLLNLDTPESVSSLLTNLFPHMLNGLKSSTDSLFGTLRLIKTIYSGYTFNPLLYQYFLKIIPGIAEVIYSILSNKPPNLWDILEECCSCIHAVAEHFSITGKHMLIEMQAIPELCIIFKDIIELDIPDVNLQYSSIIHVGTDEIHCKYNATKGYVFKTINICIQCLKDYKKKNESAY